MEPTYDGNGNMTQFVHQYTYDYRNQLVKGVTGTGIIVDYKYDTLGRRIEKTVSEPNKEKDITRYIHDGWQVIEERDDKNLIKAQYVYGNGIDERVEMGFSDKNDILLSYYPIYDQMGNAVAVADNLGQISERYDYPTYGAPRFHYDLTPPKPDKVEIRDGNVEV